jgi:hypothetical protein
MTHGKQSFAELATQVCDAKRESTQRTKGAMNATLDKMSKPMPKSMD